MKSTNAISTLRLMTGLTLNDQVTVYGYHEGSNLGGGIFKVIEDQPVHVISLNSGTNGGDDIEFTTATFSPFSGGIDENDVFTIKFKLPDSTSLPKDSTKFIMSSTNSGTRLGLTAVYVDKIQFRLGKASETDQISIADEFGVSIPNTALLNFGEWYQVSIHLKPNQTITNPSFSIGNPFGQNLHMEVESFTMMNRTFPFDEGSGTSVNDDQGNQGTIDSGQWQIRNVDDGALLIQTTSGVVLRKQLPKNTVTPFDFGAINNETVTDFSNDASEAIQKALDSGYDVEIPPSRLYIASSIYMHRPVHLRMHGSYVPMDDFSTSPSIQQEEDSTSILYSDQNIDYIVVRSHNVKIYNGLIYTAASALHTKAAIHFDINYRIWRTDVVGTNVYGNRNDLSNTGIGTIAFQVGADNLSQVGYLTEGKIDGRAYYCAKGVHITPLDTSASGAFVNNIDFTVNGDGCKMFYDIAFGSLYKIKSVCQDRAVLNQQDSDSGAYTAFRFNCNNSQIDALVFDPAQHANDPVDMHRHKNNLYMLQGINNSVDGLMQKYYQERNVDSAGIELNRNQIIRDPRNFVLSNRAGLISQLNNDILFAGNEGKVSYKGYKAPNTNWFDTHLHPANVSTTGSPNLQESVDVKIYNSHLLLTNDKAANVVTGHKIDTAIDPDLHFAEIVIDTVDFQKFTDFKMNALFLKLGSTPVKNIRCVLHFLDPNPAPDPNNPTAPVPPKQEIREMDLNPYDSTFRFENDALIKLYGNIGSESANWIIEKVIIRLIGQQESNITHIRDILLDAQYNSNSPGIHIGGNQRIYGNHYIDETLSADEFSFEDKGDDRFSGKVLQVKKGAQGGIGLYPINSSDLSEEDISTSFEPLLANTQSGDICQVTSSFDVSPKNGVLDAIFYIGNDRYAKNSLEVEFYANGVSIGVVNKLIRGLKKSFLISYPLEGNYPLGTQFSFRIKAEGDLNVLGSTKASILRLTKSVVQPEPGIAVSDATSATDVVTQFNALLSSLRDAGFIQS